MGRSAADDQILSYNDTVLRRSDLDILGGPHYLNDRIIEFYFTYLSSTYPTEDIYLVPPSIAFWLQNCSDEAILKTFIEPLNLLSKKLVIFPVNNNEDVTQAEGGTHWSLLAFYRPSNVFVHHDSMRGSNKSYSKRLYTSVVRFMGSSDDDISYEEDRPSPQQMNGYDCGLFVCAIARVICGWYTCAERVDNRDLWCTSVKEQVTSGAASNLRTEILNLIKGLMST